MERFLWVCFAGAIGSGTRYLIGLWAVRAFGTTFPYGTLIVNILGCFLIAAVMHVGLETTRLPPGVRIAITAGFLGGLTTYSSFNFETTELLRSGAWRLGLVNVALTLVACLGAGVAGTWAARKLFGG